MKKILIIVVIISAIMILLGDYINSLLVSVSGTLPIVLQPFAMFITFYAYVFDVIFSNYYLSLFINIIIVLFLFSLLVDWLVKTGSSFVSNPAGFIARQKEKKQKQKMKNSTIIKIGKDYYLEDNKTGKTEIYNPRFRSFKDINDYSDWYSKRTLSKSMHKRSKRK